MYDGFPASFSQTFQVRYDECGAGGALRAAVHLRLAQEIAFEHSAACGFPLSWYEEHRLFWVVRRIHLVMRAPARYGEALIYTTRLAGARRVMARRITSVRRAADGADIASATTDWIFTSEGTQTARIHADLVAAFPAMAKSVIPLPPLESTMPQHLSFTPAHIRVGDLDGVGHVNNPVYLDLLDDAVARAGGRTTTDAHPRTYDLQYESAVAAGDALQDVGWLDGGAWHYRLERTGGGLVLRGRLAQDEGEGAR